MVVNQQQQQQQRGLGQPESSSNISPGPQARQNQTLVCIEGKRTPPSGLQSGVSGQNKTLAPTKKPGTPAVVPQPKKITRTKEEEDMEKGVRSGAIYTSAPSSAPPPYPIVSGDMDLEDDPKMVEAIYAVIVDAKETV